MEHINEWNAGQVYLVLIFVFPAQLWTSDNQGDAEDTEEGRENWSPYLSVLPLTSGFYHPVHTEKPPHHQASASFSLPSLLSSFLLPFLLLPFLVTIINPSRDLVYRGGRDKEWAVEGRFRGLLWRGEQVGSDTHLLVWMCAGKGKFSTPSSVFYMCISCMSIGDDGVGVFAIVIMHSCDFYKRSLKKEITNTNGS